MMSRSLRILARQLGAQPEQGPFTSARKAQLREALVVSVGSGTVPAPTPQALWVRAGDLILIGKHSGSEVRLDGQAHLMLGEDDVLAILESRREDQSLGSVHELVGGDSKPARV